MLRNTEEVKIGVKETKRKNDKKEIWGYNHNTNYAAGLGGLGNTWIPFFKYWAIIRIIGLYEVKGHDLIYILKR